MDCGINLPKAASSNPVIELTIPGEPMAVQSVRSVMAGKFIRHYQPAGVVNWKSYISAYAASQLPDCWSPLAGPLLVQYLFVFGPLKSFSKKTKNRIHDGVRIYKDTKPDLSDNLKKGLNDALTGILWTDDSQIAAETAEKVYGESPRIEIRIFSGLEACR